MANQKAKTASKFGAIFDNANSAGRATAVSTTSQVVSSSEVEEVGIQGTDGTATVEHVSSVPVVVSGRSVGRPPGKRSDPEWKQYSVLLRRTTQREASNMLRDKDGGLDLSGLIESLLEGWIKQQG
jgi:hypothetical protein